MKLIEFDFTYPPNLVAQYPSVQRGKSRLLVAHRKTKELHHTTFDHIADFLEPNDCLVLNDTKVFPARLLGKKETGGKIEIFLLHQLSPPVKKSFPGLTGESNFWFCLHNSVLKKGQKILFQDSQNKSVATIQEILGKEQMIVRFECETSFSDFLKYYGHIPLPPYIERPDEVLDSDRYQTLFSKNSGAVAAPTAGLHWTEELLNGVKKKGIEIAPLTLHVGAGTFLPIRVDEIQDHKMHSEYVEISKTSSEKINEAKRVVAIGTTTVRALESLVQEGKIISGSRWTDLFIYPGYEFQGVDVLQTNFHQPKSSLLVMISAFAGRDFIFRCYEEAIQKNYQLFSYGDTMLIL